MSKPTMQQRYLVSVYEQKEAVGTLIFTFVPNGVSLSNPGRGAKRVPRYIVAVRQENGEVFMDWAGTPDPPGTAKAEIETEIQERITDRAIWIDRVRALVNQLEQWAKEMNWSTRRVDKKLDDARIGKHHVPALLMQEDTCRILLEPVGRSAPGAEGVVDLYLMPAYDDIASLYHDGHQWNIHYMFPDGKPVATVRAAAAIPLSKEAFESVLAEMRQHAA